MTSRHLIKRLTMAMALAMVLAMGAAAHAKVAVVYLRDRPEPLKGELVQETPDKLFLKIAGISTPINKSDVVKMEWELSLTEQYTLKRAQIKDSDLQARYELANWASRQMDTQADHLAQAELQSILQAKPNFKEADLLLQLVSQRIKAVDHPADQQHTQPAAREAADNTAPAADQGPDKTPLLSREDINLIKVLELDLKTKPAVVLPPKAIGEFLDEYRANKVVEPYTGRDGERKFKNLKGYEQVQILFNAEARKYYKEVIVRDEPAPLTEFRTTWYTTLVLRNCASCHADGNAKGLDLITRNATREDVAYTNFLILTRASAKGHLVIDRKTPENSLLLQYALPRSEAAYPHPDVKNFKPYFTGPRDPSFVKAAAWITSLYPFNTNYPVDYQTPTHAKTPDTQKNQNK